MLIWTTTPWTLIANVAVAVHPDFDYSYVKTLKGNLIIASVLLEKVLSAAGIEKYELIRSVSGKKLEGLIYGHPFGFRQGKVVLASYVSSEDGSGLVHIAPGHGAEDYQVGLKYGLEIVMPVDPRGKFDSSAGEFSGLNVYDANKNIIEKLQSIGALLFAANITHSYPHCWRCKKPIIFRATKQWFLMIDHNDLRNKVLEEIKTNVNWIPSAGRERIAAMVGLRPDWCLSRQRYWGVPVPALVCLECGEEFFNAEAIDRFAHFVNNEGSDSWFVRDIKDFIPEGLICPVCNKGKTFSKGADILDVWFDSGVSHQAVLNKRPELGGSPCALYLEGSDQHRGWFQSSIIPSVAISGKAPFANVLTHGFVVDGDGRKMSKSQGNVVSPHDIIKDYGADILRMWVASSDYNEDIRISKEIMTRLSEAYRKIRNTARFILSNLYDFSPDKDSIKYEDLKELDKWILFTLDQNVLAPVEGAYENFEFHKAYKKIYDFCNESLSMYYLDMVKGRLYTSKSNSIERRASQTVLYQVLDALVRVMAPILPFTAEEIWQSMPKRDSEVLSVHLLDWPMAKPDSWKDKAGGYLGISLHVINLIPYVAKALEEKRCAGLIGSSFDAKIKLLTNSPERYTLLVSLKEDLCEIFKVSYVEVAKDSSYSDIAVEVSKADGVKCERCWNYSLTVGVDKEHSLLCNKCLTAIGGK